MGARGPVRPTAVALALALAAPAAAWASSGTAEAPDAPRVTSVSCRAEGKLRCPAEGLVRGGLVAIAGADLQATTAVVFLGRRGRRDNARVGPRSVASEEVIATVPGAARTGRIRLLSSIDVRRTTPDAYRVTDPPARDLAPHSKFFFAGRHRPSFTFKVSRPGQVAVELVRERDSAVVKTWTVDAQAGANTVTWRGSPRSRGRFQFRLAAGSRAAAAPTAENGGAFAFFNHLFPIRGRHNLGYTNTNNFGGGRDHQGQDMFAECGTPLAIARGGRVRYAGYHSAAGNYAVIDGARTGLDYVYMHLREAALVEKGARVHTGQLIGYVGDTGRASGCHLHFEIWSAPGWYRGGRAIDPLPRLRRWDRVS